MNKYFKIPVCAMAFVAAGLGAMKAYNASGYNIGPNYMSNASLLNAENISAYGDGGTLGDACKFINGIWDCIKDIVDPTIDENSEPEPTHYIISIRSCCRGYDAQGHPIHGTQDCCIEQQGAGSDQCTLGWTGACV